MGLPQRQDERVNFRQLSSRHLLSCPVRPRHRENLGSSETELEGSRDDGADAEFKQPLAKGKAASLKQLPA